MYSFIKDMYVVYSMCSYVDVLYVQELVLIIMGVRSLRHSTQRKDILIHFIHS